MVGERIEIIDLETHETRDIIDKHVNGKLTVLWRNWDKKINVPQMVYLSSINPGERKGPHLHTKRSSYFFCISGEVIFIIKDENNKFLEIKSTSADSTLIHVPKNIASAHINVSNQPAKILVFADVAWKPNDNEMQNIEFDDYAWKKWNLNLVP